MDRKIWIILIGAALIGALYLYITIKRKLRLISRLVFGKDSMIEGLKSQDGRLATTPKSVSGMTSIYLPQIQRDFPEFSLPEFVRKSENQLKACLGAVEAERIDGLSQASGDLQNQIRLWIEDNRRRGVHQHFGKIKIHRTEIARYRKQEGSCVITLQSALEYEYWEEQEEAKESGKEGEKSRRGRKRAEKIREVNRVPHMVQARYNMELMYVQDTGKLLSESNAVAVTCPQCGAPVAKLGSKYCEYCGSGIEPVNIRVWSLNRIQEG